MPTFQVAHINQQGVDLVIILVQSSFGTKSNHEQDLIMQELQAKSISAGLRGNVVPVWEAGGGRLGFRAPQNQHAFFQSITPSFINANINKSLNW